MATFHMLLQDSGTALLLDPTVYTDTVPQLAGTQRTGAYGFSFSIGLNKCSLSAWGGNSFSSVFESCVHWIGTFQVVLPWVLHTSHEILSDWFYHAFMRLGDFNKGFYSLEQCLLKSKSH